MHLNCIHCLRALSNICLSLSRSLSHLCSNRFKKDPVSRHLLTLLPWSTPPPLTCQWWMERRWRTSAPSSHRGRLLRLRPALRSAGYTTQSKRQPITPCGWTEPKPWPPHLYTMATSMSHLRLAPAGGATKPKAKRRNVRKGQGPVDKIQDIRSEITSAKPKTQVLTDSRRKSPLSLTSPSLPAGHPSRAPAGHF